MHDNIYRHRCRKADALYDDGAAMLFFDIWIGEWTLVQSDFKVWRAWCDHRTQPHPLASEASCDYRAHLAVACCPWCGLILTEDPNFLEAERWVEALLSLVKSGAVGGGEG